MILRANTLLMGSLVALPWRFLFRREKKSSRERDAAMDDFFEAVRIIVATATALKPEWVDAWERRGDVELPPKYQPDQYLYPRAIEAAIDARYTRNLLYQNRWNSTIEPLFSTYDHDAWAQMRATIERSSGTLAGLRDTHREVLRPEEASWAKRAVAGMDAARAIIRRAEQEEIPTHDVIAKSTFQALYTVLQLSETVLDGLRHEALER